MGFAASSLLLTAAHESYTSQRLFMWPSCCIHMGSLYLCSVSSSKADAFTRRVHHNHVFPRRQMFTTPSRNEKGKMRTFPHKQGLSTNSTTLCNAAGNDAPTVNTNNYCSGTGRTVSLKANRHMSFVQCERATHVCFSRCSIL